MTVRCCPPHSCPYSFHNALADAGRWPPPAVPVSAQASLRLRAGFTLPVRALATATAALGFMALNIKRRGNKTERVKSSPLIYTVSYKLERMGHGAALSARDPLHSSRPQGRGGCPVRRTASGVGRERSRLRRVLARRQRRPHALSLLHRAPPLLAWLLCPAVSRTSKSRGPGAPV